MDPMRTPSRALYGFLKAMLSEFKLNPFKIRIHLLLFYLSRLSRINLQNEGYSTMTLVSADFSDAYTETFIPNLKKSIGVIGNLLGYDDDKSSLIKNLVELVFTNSYFYTPYGLYKQTRGMPMGDFSSRESLDLVLSRSEFVILLLLRSLDLKLNLFVRLVDDISIIHQGDFRKTIQLIELMVKQYPEMPLNFQISFGYSRFLDLHVYNILEDTCRRYIKTRQRLINQRS